MRWEDVCNTVPEWWIWLNNAKLVASTKPSVANPGVWQGEWDGLGICPQNPADAIGEWIFTPARCQVINSYPRGTINRHKSSHQCSVCRIQMQQILARSLVGGSATPLKNMSSSIGMMRFPINMGKCQKWQPNHQPGACNLPFAMPPKAPGLPGASVLNRHGEVWDHIGIERKSHLSLTWRLLELKAAISRKFAGLSSTIPI